MKKGETLVWEEDLVCPSLQSSQVSIESFVEKRKIKKKIQANVISRLPEQLCSF